MTIKLELTPSDLRLILQGLEELEGQYEALCERSMPESNNHQRLAAIETLYRSIRESFVKAAKDGEIK